MATSVLEVHILLQRGLFSVPNLQYPYFWTYTSLNVSSATVKGLLQKNMELIKLYVTLFVAASEIQEKLFGQNCPRPVPGGFILHMVSSIAPKT